MTHGKGDGRPCCPKFDPTSWDGKTHEWKDKPFTLESIPQFLHMPFPPMFARTVSRMWKQAQEAGAAPEMKDFLLMAYDPSPWKSDLYLAVAKEVPGAKNVALSGAFFTKVFDGFVQRRTEMDQRNGLSDRLTGQDCQEALRLFHHVSQVRQDLRAQLCSGAGSGRVGLLLALFQPPDPHSWGIEKKKN